MKKDMIKKLLFCSSFLPLALLACNGSDVTRPADVNDYDAIYHIITIDKPSEFNINLLDFSIPDTTVHTVSYVEPILFWMNLSHDSLDLPIDIVYPQSGDSLGSLPEADARLIKHFYGTLEIMGIDTSSAGDTLVRLSKNFTITGEISAHFVRYGGDYNWRRGWLLRYLSDVTYTAGYPQGISQIVINSSSYSDYILVPDIKALSDIPQFAPGESVQVTVYGSNPADIYRLRYPSNGDFQTVTIALDDSNNHSAVFKMPDATGYNHFLVEAFNIGSFQETGIFRHKAVGAVFKVE